MIFSIDFSKKNSYFNYKLFTDIFKKMNNDLNENTVDEYLLPILKYVFKQQNKKWSFTISQNEIGIPFADINIFYKKQPYLRKQNSHVITTFEEALQYNEIIFQLKNSIATYI